MRSPSKANGHETPCLVNVFVRLALSDTQRQSAFVQKTVIIVGAGVIGAAVAYRVSQSGARVIVLDAEQAGATPASFGWINASYFLNEDHFRLRAEAMAAWHELQQTLELPISWCGSLCWEEGRFEMRQEDLKRLGYDV